MSPDLRLGLAALVLSGAAAAGPVAARTGVPALRERVDARRLRATEALGEARAGALKVFEQHAPDSRWLGAWDDLNAWIEDVSAPVSLLENVHPDKAMRDAAQACNQRWSEFGSALGQNETLYRALTGGASRAMRSSANSSSSRARDFEDSGVVLAPAERAPGEGAQRPHRRSPAAVRTAHPRRPRARSRSPTPS